MPGSVNLVLPSAQINVLVALFEVQPCTVSVLKSRIGAHVAGADRQMTRLRELGLVRRRKYRPPKQTREQILGFAERTTRGVGKRPYLYALTPRGRVVARHLHAAMLALSENTPGASAA